MEDESACYINGLINVVLAFIFVILLAKMAVKYLFLILLVNMPFVIGFYINGMPKELHQDYTSKPMVYNDQYGNQQTMVCIPVPVIIQGMNPENTSRLEHRDSTSQGGASAPSHKPSVAVDFWTEIHRSAGNAAKSRRLTTSTQLPSMDENSD